MELQDVRTGVVDGMHLKGWRERADKRERTDMRDGGSIDYEREILVG
jgi:hypothetical protein